jgi:hypothetical protein
VQRARKQTTTTDTIHPQRNNETRISQESHFNTAVI